MSYDHYDRMGWDRECQIELFRRGGWEKDGTTIVRAGESLSAERKRIAALEAWPCWLVVLEDVSPGPGSLIAGNGRPGQCV